MEQLSNKIRELRFMNGEMTQMALAERVGISRQTINAIENCRHSPTVSVAIRIAHVFQVPVGDLFTLDYEGKPAPIDRPHKAAVDQSPVSVREPVLEEREPSPVGEKTDRHTTLADLRNVLGP